MSNNNKSPILADVPVEKGAKIRGKSPAPAQKSGAKKAKSEKKVREQAEDDQVEVDIQQAGKEPETLTTSGLFSLYSKKFR